ncbi:YadA-like family protein [Basfia succiniciproducens]|uniref:YadA-like family protein n=1 Tax=Basfia succiniciproducens TaxID=653940 RepID=UPI003FCE9C3F
MNHIYKVVWSKTTNSLVVVSELASSQGKAASVVSKGYKLSSVFKKSFQLTALSALLISVMPAAQAAIAVGASTVTNWNGAVSVSLNGASATGASVPYNYHTPNNENYPDQGNNSNSSNIYSGTLSAAQSIAIGINATSQSGSIALGDNSRATGGLSLALGAFSQTNQAGAIALGTSALASGFNSFATMRQAAATADFAIAMGTAANANATNSIAMGSSALALGNQSIAIGSAAMEKKVGSAGGESYRTDYVGTTNTKAQGDRTIAFGVNTSTTSNDSIAIGSNSKTNSGTGAIAIGWCSSTSYQDSVAIGSNATANGGYSLALGYNATSTNLTSISIGWNAAASNTGGGHSQGAVAIGPKTTALGNQSVVLGASASAVEQATAIGNDSKANGFGSIVIGGDDTGYSRNPNSDPYTPTALGGERIGYLANTATGDNSNYRSSLSSGIGSVVVGVHGQALSNGSTAIGVYSTAGDNGITFTNDTTSTTAIEATAIGALSRAKSIRSSAIGYSAEALGNYSTVVGANSTANGTSSLALGHNSTAYSTYSLAAGYNASANLSNSTAIGSSSNASGLNAIALGTGAQALNTNTISIGTGNIVSGENSGAIGDPNNITGSNSYALGNNNVIYANNSFAVGNSIYISDTAQNTLAFGTNISVPTSTKTNNTLIGTSAKIQGGESSIAFGTNATVSNSVQSSAIAIGNQSKVEAAVGGIAIGNGSTISSSANNGSIALGQKTNVTGVSSIALGNNASVTGTQQGSVAIGNNTNVTNTGQGTVAVGSDTNVTVGNAVAIGDHVNVKGQRSIAIGSSSNVAEGVVNATTIGTGSNVTQNDGTAVGYNAIVSNYNGLALGANATSTAQRAVALGADSVAGREGWDQAAYDPYIPANANTSQSAAITATKATNNYGAVSVGSDTVKRQIINVAAGSADSDAVNVAQLKAAIGSVNTSWNIQENGTQKDIVNAGDNVSFANGTGTTANVSVDSTGKTSTVKYSVNKSGLSVATDGTVTAAANGDNFATAEQVAKAINDSEKTTTVEKGSDKVSVTGTTTGTKTNYVVDLSNAAKSSLDKADSALQSWTAQVNGANAKVVNQTNNTVNFVNGTNTIVKADANGNISVSTADNVTFNTVNASSFNAGNISIGTNGINAGNTTITNVANGINASDAVNVSQLNATNANVTNNTQNITKNAADIQSTKDGLNATNATVAGNTANITNNTNAIANNTAAINKGINFGNGTTDNNFALGDTINVTSDSNIVVNTEDDGVKLSLADNVTVGNVTVNNTFKAGDVTINSTGIDAGNHAITNVANGTQDSDAVNLSQLNATNANVTNNTQNITNNTAAIANNTANISNNTNAIANNTQNITKNAADIQSTKDGLNATNATVAGNTANITNNTNAIANNTAAINKGINFGNGTTDNNFALGSTINVTSDSNIEVSTVADGVKLALASSIAVDNLTANNSVKVGNVALTQAGINAGNHAITNVTNGTNATDAVNLSQLNASKSSVEAGDNVAVTSTSDANGTVYTVNANTSTVSNGSDKVTVTSSSTGNHTTNYAVDLSEAAKSSLNKADSALQSWTAQVNGADAKVVNQTNNTVNFVNGTNTIVKADANGNISVSTADNVTFNTVNASTFNAGNVSISNSGINAGNHTITNVANGTQGSDAVNLSQLNATNANVTNNTNNIANNTKNITNVTNLVNQGFNIGADNGTDDNVKLGEKVDFNGDGNIVTTVTNNAIAFALSNTLNLTDAGSVTMGDTVVNGSGMIINNGSTNNQTVSLTKDGLNNGGNTITNVANGSNATDAVNLSQLNAGKSSVEAGDNVAVTSTSDANGTVYTVNANSSTVSNGSDKITVTQTDAGNHTSNYAVDLSEAAKSSLNKADSALQSWTAQVNGTDAKVVNQTNNTVNFVNGTNTIVKADANGNISVSTADNVTFNTVNASTFNAGGVSISNSGINAGNTTITNVANGTQDSDAVNLSQLNATNANVTNNTNNIANNTQNITNNANNIANNTQNITNNTAAIANNTANISNNTNAIANNTAAINKGINFGNGMTDNNFALGDTINVTSDSNIVVNTEDDGVKLSLADNVTVGNVTVNNTFKAGDVTINSTGIDAGNHAITNVANGTQDSDAVNLSQLNATNANVTNNTQNITNNTAAIANNTANITNNTNAIANNAANITNNTNAINKGINFGNGTTAYNFALGSTINVTSDSNIEVSTVADGVKLALASSIAVNNITVNDTFKAGDVTINSTGIDAGNHTITNVAKGVNATDAVNLSQLESYVGDNSYNWNLSDGNNSSAVADNSTVTITGSANADSANTSGIVTELNGTNVSVDLSNKTKADIQQGVDANTTVNTKGITFAADSGTATERKLGETLAINGDGDLINTTVSAGKVEVAASDKLKDAVNNATTALQNWTAQVNGADAKVVNQTNNTVNFVNGTNTIVKADANGNISVSTADNVTFNTVNASTFNAGNVSISNSGINAGNHTITNVANGTQGGDAVNLSQLNATNANVTNNTNNIANNTKNITNVTNLVNQGFNIGADNGADDNVKLSEKVDFNGDGNIVTTVTNNAIAFALSHTLNLTDAGSVTMGDTVVNGSGMIINNGSTNNQTVSLTKDGLNNGGNTITNVANGSNATDAVNLSQLNAGKSSVEAGDNVAVTSTSDANGTVYTVNANTSTVSNGSNKITVTQTDAGNHTSNYAVDLSDAAKASLDKADSALQSLTTSADGAKAQTLDKDNSNANFISGSNIRLTPSADGIMIATAENVTFTNVNTTNFKAGDVTINSTGIDAGNHTITNVAKGVNATDAVNLSQLESYVGDNSYNWNLSDGTNSSAVADNSTVAITGSANGDGANTSGIVTELNGTNVSVDLSDKAKESLDKADSALQSWTAQVNGTDAKVVNQTNNTVNFVDGSNINITNDNGTIKVATADNVTFNTVNASTFNAGNVSISNSGINAGNHTITNVSNGTKDSDAVNLSQLNATNANVTNNTNNIANNTQNITSNTNAINKGINFGNGTTANNFALGSTINVTSDSNIVVNTTNAGVQLGLADNIAVDNVTVNNTFKAGDVTINNNGIDAGNHAITNVTNGTNATDAVNVSQLNASKSSVEAGDNVAVTSTSDANGTVYTVNANTSTVSNGSNKITVTQTDAGNHTSNYAVDLSDAAKASLDKADSALQSLTTSADGAKAQTLDKDNSNANFISGSNIRLTPSADGITIATAENVTFTNVNTTNFKAGDVTINSTGIDAGNHTITNVAAGTNKTDAVNLGQLEQFIGDNSYNWNLSDGTNSSAVADNSTVAIEGSANGDSANTSGIVTMLDGTNVSVDLSDKAKVSLDKADSALQSWTAQVNGADAKVVNQTNNTVNFVNGTNTIVKADANGNISVSTADNVTFNTVNASTFNAGNVSISNSGINAGNHTITNVANGTQGSDAVNLSQLNATNANVTNNTNNIANNTQNITNVTNLVNQGFNIGADNGTDDNVKLSEKVDFNGDGNIVTTVTNNAIAFALSHTLNLTGTGSVTMGDTVVNGSGMIINNGSTNNQTVSLTKDGLNNGGNTITNVANGSNATDAVNLSQLNAGKSSVEAGDNVAVTSTSGANGTVYTVNANTSTVSNGSDKITVTQTDAGNHTSNYAVDLSDAAKASLDKADNALQSWTAQVNGADAKVVNQTNNTVNFVNGTNTIVKADANGNISVSTADNVTFNTVNASTFNAGDVSFNTSGINAGNHTITNVANGSNASDAVNVAQLEANTTRYYSVNSTVAGNRNNDGATGINAMAAGANAVASGDNATAIGQGTKANSAAAIAIGNNANATSSRNDSVIAIGNNAQSTGSYSIAVGTNSVANHTWSMAMGISAKAIDDYATALGSSAQATSQWTTALGAGANATGSAATAVGSNTTATAGGATVVGYNSSVTGANTTALGNNINVDTEGSVVLGNGSAAASATTETTATVNNLTYSGFAGADNVATGDYVSVGSVGEERQIKNVAAGNVSATSTDAINGSQLYATQNVIGNVANSVVNNFGGNATVDQNGNITFTDIGGTGANTIHDAIQNVSNVANMGWNVQANGDTATKVAPGDTVQFINGQNIEIDRDGTNITVATANNVTFTNVNTTTLTAGPVTINSTGIDAGNHTITNVGKGVNATDAVNLSQLESYVGDNSYNWNLSDGNNSSAVADNSTVTITGSANADSANTSGIVTELNGTNVSVDLSNKTKADIQQGVDANTTVNTKGITFAADSGTATERKLGETLAINGDGDLINTTVSAGKVEVAASDKLKDAVNNATTALQNWTAQVNGADAKVVNQTNNTVNFVDGSNINITNDNGTIKVATADNVSFNSVNTTEFKAGDVTINSTGINVGNHTITNVANGTQDSDAVNLSQLNATNANVTNNTNNIANNTANITNNTNAIANNTAAINKGINFGNGTTDNNFALGSTINVTSDSNIEVSTVADGVKLALASSIAVNNVTVNDTFKAGDVTINSTGIDAGNHTITNVVKGVNATDAVNLSQLNASKSSVEAGDNVAVTSTSDANGTVYTVNANTSTVSNGSDKVTVTSSSTGNHTTNYAVDLSEAAKASLDKADSALQSWTAQVNGADAKVVNQTNNTVNFVNGTNTIVKADANGNISVSTADNVTFNTVNASTFNAGGVSISNSGINAGNTTITNVANGTQDSDAVNLSQLNATNANVTNNTNNIANNTQNITNNANNIANNTANITNNTNAINKGINFGNGSTANNFALGSTINVTSDSNIVVNTTSSGVQLGLADSIAVGNVTVNDTFKAGDVTINNNGIDAGNHTITNVAAGTNATDAVNLAQLESYVGDNSYNWNLSDGNNSSAVADNSTVTITGSANADSANISGIVTELNGTNVSVDLSNKTKADIQQGIDANTTVNSKGITFAADSGTATERKLGETLAINGDGDLINTTVSAGKVEVAASDKLKGAVNNATTALQSWTAQVNGADAKVVDQTNNTVNFVDGSNINITNDNGTIKVATTDNVTFNTVNASTFNAGNVSISNSGINAGNHTITNVSNGTKDSDAVNLSQLNATNANVTNNTNNIANNTQNIKSVTNLVNQGFNIGADNGTDDNVKLGEKVDFNGDGNIVTTVTNNAIAFALSHTLNLTDAGSVTMGDTVVNSTGMIINNGSTDNQTVSLTKDGLNNGGNTITNVAAGNVSATSTDAINGSQLYATQNVIGNVANSVVNNFGGNAAVDQNGNITFTDIGGTGANTIHDAILNVSNVANMGWNVQANGDTATKVVPGGTVQFINGQNIEISRNGTNITVATADNVTFNNVNTTTLTAGPVTINNSGIDAGATQIKNVAAGTEDTDAVNYKQLKDAVSNSSTTWNLTDNNDTANSTTVGNDSTVSFNNGTNTVAVVNGTNVSYSLADNIALTNNGSVTVGNTTVDNAGISVGDNVTVTNTGFVAGNVTVKQDGINAGGNKITGVADGDISANSTDAVNGGQLYNVIQNATAGVKTEVEAGKNIVVTNSTGANGQTVYTVETAKEVDFDKVTVGNVTINKDTNKVSGIANGDISATSSDAINGSQLYTANQNVADHLGGGSKVDENGNVTAPTYTVVTNPSTNATTTANNVGDAINGLNTAISKPLTFAADSGSNSEMRLGSTVSIKGGVSDSTKLSDNNIGVVSDGKGNLTVKLAKDISGLNSVTTGDTTMNSEGITIKNGAAGSPVSLTKNGLNNGGNRITNVAPGEVSQDSTDAVNGSQLHATNQQVVRNAQAINQVANHVNKVDRNLRAGIAGAMAAGGLYHATLPGKSMVAAGVGTYRGESAIAVGYSRLSDNGKLGVKFSVNGNTRGDTGAAASVGYQW